MKTYLLFFILLIPTAVINAKEYIVGSGSEFQFIDQSGEKVSLNIYITQSQFSKLGIEYYFSTNSIAGIELWQQYLLNIQDKGLVLQEGYVLSADMKFPEIMTKEFRENNENGVKIEDFLFSDQSEIEKYKIGIETIEVPAGNITSTHYQKKRDKQLIDFWISDKAGSIGLVKLVSKGGQDQNYSIELVALLKNVKAKINPKTAVPLTDKGRQFLQKKK